jgi:hypothetical protein
MCIEMTSQDELRYDFEADRPIDFDIHYHDGLTVHFPVRHPGIAAQAGRFVSEQDQSYCLMWLNRSLMEASLTYRVIGP